MSRLASSTATNNYRATRATASGWNRFMSSSTVVEEEIPVAAPVVIEFEELIEEAPSTELFEKIKTAYGPDGLGLLVVKGVPEFLEKRRRMLPLIHTFANLPKEERDALESEVSKFGVGWFHGKEKLGASGEPDLLKAAFKANPQYNEPTDDQALIDAYPEYCYPNVWPSSTVPDFESAFMDLGQLIVNTGMLVARQCDLYVQSEIPGYDRSLYQIIKQSVTCKARALHYYPMPAPSEGDNSAALRDWCGWHNDHGSLTGLTSSMFMDADGKEVPNPDPRAGLVVAPRETSPYAPQVKVNIPADHIAFQIGECSQLISGGRLMATPHKVLGPAHPEKCVGISRSTFAVFMQPNLHTPISPPEGSPESSTSSSAYVPSLASRWEPGQDFITFTKKTFQKYYEFSNAK